MPHLRCITNDYLTFLLISIKVQDIHLPFFKNYSFHIFCDFSFWNAMSSTRFSHPKVTTPRKKLASESSESKRWVVNYKTCCAACFKWNVFSFHLKPLTKFNNARAFHQDFTVGKGLCLYQHPFRLQSFLCMHSFSKFMAYTSVFISHSEVLKTCFKLLMFGSEWTHVSFRSNIAFCLKLIRRFKQAFCSGNIYVSLPS